MKKIKNKNLQQNGITLIALVITIVVLLILAGVSIAMLTGENGILARVNEAKVETRGGTVQEARDLWKSNKKADELSGIVTAQTLEELLIDLKEQNQLTEEEIAIIKETGKITIGSREIIFKEENKETIKILVNSGEDGLVVLPVSENENCEINWGDGEYQKNNITKEQINKIGMNDAKVRIIAGAGYVHRYSEQNKEFLVEISGEVTELILYDHYYDDKGSLIYYEQAHSKIIEIVQWGETGLENINLEAYSNLRKIASPSEKSFVNIRDFRYSFADCTSLTNIPENLFYNCPNVTDFTSTFEGCIGLTSIPEKLFEQCENIENCQSVFRNCINLTGDVIPLWTRIENWESLDLKKLNDWIDKIPEGGSAYNGCTKVNNYELIPEYWKKLPK